MDDIQLTPCLRCSGQPVVLIRHGWPYPQVRIVCSACGREGPIVYFCPEGDRRFSGLSAYDQQLLPGLATARRQAAAAWNEGAD